MEEEGKLGVLKYLQNRQKTKGAQTHDLPPALFLKCHVVETMYHSAIVNHSQSLDLALGPVLSTLQILTHQTSMIMEGVDINSVPILLMKKQRYRKVEAPA